MNEQEQHNALTDLRKKVNQLSVADQIKLASFIGTDESRYSTSLDDINWNGVGYLAGIHKTDQTTSVDNDLDLSVTQNDFNLHSKEGLASGYSYSFEWANPTASHQFNDKGYVQLGIKGTLTHAGRTVQTKTWTFTFLKRGMSYADYFNSADQSKLQALTHALEPNSVLNSDRQLAASPQILTNITVDNCSYSGQELADAGILNNIRWSGVHRTPASSEGKEEWTPTAGIILLFSDNSSTGQMNASLTIRSTLVTTAIFATTQGNNTWHTINVGNGIDAGNAVKGVGNASRLSIFSPTYTWLKDMPNVTPGMTAAQIIANHKLTQEDVNKLEAGPHTLYVLVSYTAKEYHSGVASSRPDGYQIVKINVNSLNQIIHVEPHSPVNVHVGQLSSDFDTDSAADHMSAWYIGFDGQKKDLIIDPGKFGQSNYPIKSIIWDQKPGSYVDPTTHQLDNTKASIKVVYADSASDEDVDQSIITIDLDKATAKTGLLINGGDTVNNSADSALQSSTSVDSSQITRWQPSYEWVYDQNGTALDASHQYDTKWNKNHTSFTGYVKVTYYKADRDGNLVLENNQKVYDGYQIVPVNIKIKSMADQMGVQLYNDLDYMNSHPITNKDDIEPQYKLTWGCNIQEVHWKAGVSQATIDKYIRSVDRFETAYEHSFPVQTIHTDSQGNKYYVVVPGMKILFTDGSQLHYGTDTTPTIPTRVYPPENKNTTVPTFVAKDMGAFNSTSAKGQLTNLAESLLGTYKQDYYWVVKDSSVHQHTLEGIPVTGYRALKDSDIASAGTKSDIYVMVKYTKERGNGEPDGYYMVNVPINLISGVYTDPQSKTFDNQAVTADQIVNELKSGTMTLKMSDGTALAIPSDLSSADIEWLDSTGGPLTDAPIYAGSYKFELSLTGFNKLKNANTGKIFENTSIDYTIKVAPVSVTLNGKGERDYNGHVVSTDDLKNDSSDPIKVMFTFPGNTSDSYTLVDGDYSWYTKDGNNYVAYNNNLAGSNGAPTGVGTYYLKINDTGKQNIQNWLRSKLGDKYFNSLKWSPSSFSDDNYASFKINQEKVKFILGGESSGVYIGSAQAINNIKSFDKGGSIYFKTNYPDFQSTNLEAGDVDWYDSSMNKLTGAPTDVGTYYIKLKDSVISDLKNKLIQAAGYGLDGTTQNITFEDNGVGGQATYKITPSSNVVTVSGTQTNEYSGSEISVDYQADGTNSVKVTIAKATGNTDGKVASLTGVTLTSGDFKIVDNPAINVGDYHIVLTDAGLNKIKNALGSNYDITNDGTKYGTLTITPAEASAKLAGSNHKDYDGSAVTLTEVNSSTGDIEVALTYPGSTAASTYTLHAGDYIWYNEDGSEELANNGAAPTNAGTYTIKLTNAGITNIEKAIKQKTDPSGATKSNVKFTDKDGNGTILGSAKFTINKRALTDLTFSGSDSKTYDGSVGTIDPAKAKNWTATGLQNNETLNVSGLTADDFKWESGSAPTNKGDYNIVLSQNGINKLLQNNSNYIFNLNSVKIGSHVVYTINPSKNVVTVSGTQTNEYTGSGIGVNYQADGTNSVKVTIAKVADNTDGKAASLTGVTLTSGDFKIVNDSGNDVTAINVGDYRIVLTDAGLNKIKNALGNNYDITEASDKYGKLTITPAAQINIHYVDVTGIANSANYASQGKTIDSQDKTVTNDPNADFSLSGVSDAWDYGNADWDYVSSTNLTKFPNNGQTTTDGNYYVATYNVYLKAKANNDTKTLHKTVTYVDANGNRLDVTQPTESNLTVTKTHNRGEFNSNGSAKYVWTISNLDKTSFDTLDFPATLTIKGKTAYLNLDSSHFAYSPNTGSAIKITTGSDGQKVVTLTADPDAADGTIYSFTLPYVTPVITLSGSGTKVYGSADTPTVKPAWDEQGLLPSTSLDTSGLVNADGTFKSQYFTWYLQGANNNLTEITGTPKNVGTYVVKLNAAGLAKLQADNSKYAGLTKDNFSGSMTYTITQADATATLGGSNSKTYDGAAVTLDEINSRNGDIKVTVSFPGVTDAQKTITLTANDYVWDTSDDHAPIDASTTPYTLKLSITGISRIKSLIESEAGSGTDAQGNEVSNVKFAENAVGGSAEFTINEGTEDRYIQYQFVDADKNDSTVGSPVTVSGKAGQNVTISGLDVPTHYELATGQTIPTSITFLDQSTDSAKPTVVQIKLVHQHGETTQYETRQITVHYVYGAGEHAGQKAHDDAVLDVYYKRTGDTDLVTSKMVDTAPWLFDGSYNADGFSNGYKVVSGTWTLPTSWNPVEAEVPTIDGYKAYLNGDWTKNKDDKQSTVPANKFVFPSYNNPGTSDTSLNSTAYTDAATIYEATPEHTIYYVPAEQVEGRTVTEHFKKYVSGDFNDPNSYTDADVVTLPDGTKQSYAQIKVWYKKDATGFATNGSTDPSKWKATYGSWKWDSTVGDASTPGFTVISGKGLWSGIANGSGNSWGISFPPLDGYKAISLKEDLSYGSGTFGSPISGGFTNATDPAWYYRNSLTTFYIPKSLLSKTVTRTIKITNPDGTVRSIPQKVTFNREARLNNNDTVVVLGALKDNVYHFTPGNNVWNYKSTDRDGIPTGTWAEYNVTKPGYTALVDGNVATSVTEATVTPDTADSTVDVTYIKNSGTITISHDEVDQTYTGNAADTVIPSGITHDIQKSNNLLTWPTGAENVTLDSSDFSFANTNGDILTDKPVNVGTYHIVLNKQGLDKFKNLDSNFTWKYDPKTSYVVYKITKATPHVAFQGTGSKTYDGSALSSSDYSTQIGLAITDAPNAGNDPISLTAGTDYVWTKGSHKYTTAPVDAGDYTIELTDAGKNKIKAATANGDNLDWANAVISGTGTYTINKADATVKFGGDATKTYDGSAISNYQFSYNPTDGFNAPGTTSTNFALTAGTDYVWYQTDSEGHKTGCALTNAPVNVGNYIVELTTAGINKIKDINSSNLNWTSITGSGNYDITPASATATIAGSATVTYTGSPAVIDYGSASSPNYTVTLSNNQHYTLQAGDLDFVANDHTNANSTGYVLKLTQAGLDHIKAAEGTTNSNYTWTFDSTGSSAKLIVKKADATWTLSGDNSSQYTKTYDGQDVSTADTGMKVTLAYPDPAGNSHDYLFDTSDYEIKNAAGTVVSEMKNAGTYTISLTESGINKIKAVQADNLNWSGSGQITVTINKKALTDVSFSGSDSKMYDGTAGAINADKAGNWQATGLVSGENFNATGLTDADFKWDGSTPTDAGSYEIVLNDDGLHKLQANNANYDFSKVTGHIAYTIEKADATWTLSGDNNSQYTKTYDGQAVSTADIGMKVTLAYPDPAGSSHNYSFASTDYEIKDSAGTVVTEMKNAGTYTISLTESGINKIKAIQADNLNWSGSGQITVKINKKTLTDVSFSGTDSKKYDGTAGTINVDKAGNWQATGLISGESFNATGLTNADFKWDGSTPTNAGDYQIILNDDGLQKLQSINANYDFSKVTGHIAYTIEKAKATINLAGSQTKDYNGEAGTIDASNFTPSVKTDNGVDWTIPSTTTFDSNDFIFTDDQGNQITAPTALGDYHVYLSASGLNKIKTDTTNYDWADGSLGIYKIQKNSDSTVSLTDVSDGQSETYKGSAYGNTDIDVSDYKLTLPTGFTYTLQASDLEFVPSTDATNVGTYHVELSQAGKDHLNAADPTHFSFDFSKFNAGEGTFKITKASASAAFLGNGSKTYDGNAISGYAPTVSITAPGVVASDNPALTAGTDYVWTKDGHTYTSAPVDAGTYTVELTTTGKNKIKEVNSANLTWTDAEITGTGTYIITKATPTVTFQGAGSKTYNGSALNTSDYTTQVGLAITDAPNAGENPISLTAGIDYVWTKDGHTYTTAPVDAGTYTIELTTNGKNKIHTATANGDNLDWRNAVISGTGTYKITEVAATANLSGENNRDYNGSAVSTADLNNGGNITVTIAIPNSTKTISYTLQDDDYTWTAGSAPTDQGSYTLSLNKANVLAHLKAQIAADSTWKGNVGIIASALSGTATFTVNKKAATVSLTGSTTVTYDGNQVETPLAQLKDKISGTDLVSGQSLDLSGLTADDFDWYDASGDKLNNAPTDHGTYTIKLNTAGFATLKNKNTNYSLSIKDDQNSYSYEIKQAKGSVALDGSRTITFGTADPDYYKHYSVTLTTDPTAIHGFTPSYTLQAGDLEFSSDNGRTWSTSVPTTVDTYQVKLSDAGRNNLIAANKDNGNIDWPANSFTGIKTYIIEAATATAALGGNANMTYDGQVAELSNVNSGSIQVNVTIPGTTGNHTYTLQTGDYTWNTTGRVAPTDAGDYTISFDLTATGKAHLKNFIDGIAGAGNVDIPASVTGTADFKIKQLAITVNEGNSDEKTYDSNPASISLDTLKNSLSGSGLVSGQNLDTSTLTASDFDWYQGTTKLTGAPSDAGDYTIKLNAHGLQALQTANKNYSFSAITGDYDYTINQANATIKLDEATNQQTATWDGNNISLDLTKFQPSITTDNSHQATIDLPSTLTLTAGDYQITQDGTVKTPKEPGTYTVKLTEQGWQKVRDAITGHDNYNWKSTGSGKLIINKATATAKLSGSGSVTYTGSIAQIPYPGSYEITLSNGERYIVQFGDLEFISGNNPVNVGDYRVKLSNAGLRHISEVEGNHYDYTYDNSTAILSITPASATATLEGTGQHDYDGSVASLSEGRYSVELSNGMTYNLQPGDYTWATGTVPIAAGTYNISLTTQGKNHINALTTVGTTNNYDWTFASNANFKVAQMPVTITVSNNGRNGQSVVYGQPMTIDPSHYQVIITTEDGRTLTGWTPLAGDLQFEGATPVNVGDQYKVILSEQGMRGIKAEFGIRNYTYKKTGNGNFTVTPAKATITLIGDDNMIYSGNPAGLNASKYRLTLPSGFTHTLTNSDLQFIDARGNQIDPPTNVGDYHVALTTTTLNAIEALDGNNGKNYEWTIKQNRATYEINRASEIIIHYRDVNDDNEPESGWTSTSGKALDHDQIVVGTAGGRFNLNSVGGKWNYVAAYYVLAGQNGVNSFPITGDISSDGNYYVGNYYVYLKHYIAETDNQLPGSEALVKTFTKKIVYRGTKDDGRTYQHAYGSPTGSYEYTQTVVFKRKAYEDMVTKQIIGYTDWTSDQPEFESVVSKRPKDLTYNYIDKPVVASLIVNPESTKTYLGTIVVTYRYSEIYNRTYAVTVNYVDENGQKIKDSTITDNYPDDSEYQTIYPTTITTSNGQTYEFEKISPHSDWPNGKIDAADVEVTYVYKLRQPTDIKHLVTVYYIDKDGMPIRPQISLPEEFKPGESYDVSGYETAIIYYNGEEYSFKDVKRGDQPNGKIANSDVTVTFIYQKISDTDEFKVTINYVDEDGNAIKDPVIDSMIDGAHYDVTDYKPAEVQFNGRIYRFDKVLAGSDPENGTIQDRDVVITYVYRLTDGIVIGPAPAPQPGEELKLKPQSAPQAPEVPQAPTESVPIKELKQSTYELTRQIPIEPQQPINNKYELAHSPQKFSNKKSTRKENIVNRAPKNKVLNNMPKQPVVPAVNVVKKTQSKDTLPQTGEKQNQVGLFGLIALSFTSIMSFLGIDHKKKKK